MGRFGFYLAAVFGAVTGAARAVPMPVPLLTRTVAAHSALGPVEVRIAESTSTGKPAGHNFQAVIARNDAWHWKISGLPASVATAVYVNGKWQRWYDGHAKTFEAYPAENGDDLWDYGEVLQGIKVGLQSAFGRAWLARGVVRAERFEGLPAYSITWQRSPLPAEMLALKSVVIDARTGLLLKVTNTDWHAQDLMQTASYHPIHRLAASTFMPPPGARPAKAGAQATSPKSSLVGKMAPDFTLPSLDGGAPVRLRDLRGKTVMLDFWATWCPPCRASLPLTNRAASLFKEKGLVVLTIDDESDGERVRDFVAKNAYSFTVLRDVGDHLRSPYKVTGIPTTVVIGPDGRVEEYTLGFEGEKAYWKTLARHGFTKP